MARGSNVPGLVGLSGLLDRMNSLPKELVSKSGGPAKNALKRGAELIRDEAISRAPKPSGEHPYSTGHLREQIVAERDNRPHLSGASERFRVGIKGGAQSYKNNKENRRLGRVGAKYEGPGSAFYWRFVEFGTERTTATPFLVPAFEARKEDAFNVIVDALDKGLRTIVRKLAKNGK